MALSDNLPATDLGLQAIREKLPGNPATADQQAAQIDKLVAMVGKLDTVSTKIIELLAKSEQQRALIAGIAGDTSPIQTNNISGLGTYTNLGSPSVSASNGVGYSNPFVPNGERVRFRLAPYTTGDRTWVASTSGGFCWLETDLAGTTNYFPILGSRQSFADIPTNVGSGFVTVFDRVPASVNLRLAIMFGTIGGSSGLVGTNLFVKN